MKKQDCEQLTFYQGASPASRFPSPGSAEAQQMTVTSGRKCSELLMNSGPLSSLARMLLASSRWYSRLVNLSWKAERLTASRTKTTIREYSHNTSDCCSATSSKTSVTSVTPSSFLYFRLVASTPRTGATELPLWATPNTMDSLPSRSYEAMKRQATNGGRKNRSRPGNLREQIDPLMQTAYDDARTEANHPVRMWPTPTTGAPLCGGSGNYEQLKRLVDNGTITEYEKQQMAQQGGGQLNPDWVEWLMGVPQGWTDSSKDIPIPEYDPHWYDVEPDIPRVAAGVECRVDRLKSLGNMVDPYQFFPLMECIAEILKAGGV